MKFLKHFAIYSGLSLLLLAWIRLVIYIDTFGFSYAIGFVMISMCAWIAYLTSNDL
jgi:hypothetical protein